MRGFFTILDTSLTEPGCVSLSCHALLMERYALDMGIPEENLRVSPTATPFDFWRGFGGDGLAVRSNTLVLSIPSNWINDIHPFDLDFLRSRRSKFLVVTAAGNSGGSIGRDLWYPDHHRWQGREVFDRAMASLETGRHILAKYVRRHPYDGTAIALLSNVKCGLAKEYCYSIVHDGVQSDGTSGASVNLGALVFYLFQLWDTPRAVVNTLNICAEDVGEPGIDEEFGRGVVSVVCDRVQNRERRVAADSLGTHGVSPVLAQMTGSRPFIRTVPQSLSAVSQPSTGTGFRAFYAVRGRDIGTMTGHLGGQFSLKGTDLLVSGGADYTPFGVYSSLLYTARTPFVEFGTKRNLFSHGSHTVSLLGAYGYSDGSGMSAHVGHLGTLYERLFTSGTLSLHAGYQQVRAVSVSPDTARRAPNPFLSSAAIPRSAFRLPWACDPVQALTMGATLVGATPTRSRHSLTAGLRRWRRPDLLVSCGCDRRVPWHAPRNDEVRRVPDGWCWRSRSFRLVPKRSEDLSPSPSHFVALCDSVLHGFRSHVPLQRAFAAAAPGCENHGLSVHHVHVPSDASCP